MSNYHRLIARVCLLSLMAGTISCAQSTDPLENLAANERVFLFGETDTHAPFLGQPVDAGPLNCYPQRMNQGYVLVDEGQLLYLDSIRPTGIERHKIKAVVQEGTGYVIKAKNGVGAPFDLIIEPTGPTGAMISWDGAPPEAYRRCERSGD